MSLNAKAASDMFRFIDKAKSRIQAVNREILMEVGRRLVARSVVGNPDLWHPPYWPKGYVPGHFINNWQVGIDSKIPTGIIAGSDASGAISLERLSHLGRWTVGHTYTFVNNVPYAKLLETGLHSSQVGPQGIVGITVMEFPRIVYEATIKVSRGLAKG